ncbi:hypothetical protein K280104A7_33440 [Candidatus Bariatricus faecipullorum]
MLFIAPFFILFFLKEKKYFFFLDNPIALYSASYYTINVVNNKLRKELKDENNEDNRIFEY